MPRFLPLTVKAVEKTIRDAVVVTLEAHDAEAFRFIPGQYLTFRREIGGEEVRRSYSICSGPDEEFLQVGIKRVEGGVFSTWANTELKPGDVLEAMPPMGSFHVAPAPDEARHYLMFAGGSGITPVLSLIRATLAREPKARITLVYANRSVATIMFREELEDLKNRHLGRLSILHILEEGQEVELFSGMVTEEKCAELFRLWIDVGSVDYAFICGPEPMMLAIAKSLREHGLDEGRIKFELFASSRPAARPRPRAEGAARSANTAEIAVTLDGTTRRFTMAKDGPSILDAALEQDIDAPFACKAGVCSTCRARVIEGEVDMVANHALEDYEVAQGYVLTCQCHPVSDRVAVDYDQ